MLSVSLNNENYKAIIHILTVFLRIKFLYKYNQPAVQHVTSLKDVHHFVFPPYAQSHDQGMIFRIYFICVECNIKYYILYYKVF